MYEDKEKKGSGTTKQVGVEVELQKNPRSDVADTQETSKTVAKEPEVKQVTHEQVLRRLSRSIRVPDRYSPSLHYLLLINEGKPKSFDEVL